MPPLNVHAQPFRPHQPAIQQLSIIQINAHSLLVHLPELRYLLTSRPAHIVAVQETWLKPTSPTPELPGYRWYGVDRITDTHGGGVGFFIHNSIHFRIIENPNLGSIEIATISIDITRRQRAFFSSVYIPPSTSESDIHKLSHLRLDSSILFGDFNAHHPSWSEGTPNDAGTIINDLCNNRNLTVFGLRHSATLINTLGSSSSPDFIIAGCNTSHLMSLPTTLNGIGSDHLPIHVVMNVDVLQCDSQPQQKVWRTKTLDVEQFANTLTVELERWESDNTEQTFDADSSYDAWCTTILNATQQNCQQTNRSHRAGQRWWKDKRLPTLYKRRSQLRRRTQRHRDTRSYCEYREASRAVRLAKQTVQAEALVDFCKSLTPANMHEKLKAAKGTDPLPDVVTDSTGNSLTSDQTIADALCQHFSTVADHLPPAVIPNDPPPSPLRHPLLSRPITAAEIVEQVKRLKLRKAPGPDGIFTFMIIHGGPAIIKSLQHLYKHLWGSHAYPGIWWTSEIKPLKKSKSTRTVDKFRPISLTPVPAKIFESIMRARLQQLSDLHKWVPDHQAGFRPHRSPIEHLVRLQQAGHTAFQHKQVLLVALLDLTKAYDTVSRPFLLHKLQHRGIGGHMLEFLRHFLGPRVSTVRYRAATSDPLSFPNGVPQGSPLSPLLFNIYTAEALAESGPDSQSYADDLSTWSTALTLPEAETKLEKALEPVIVWASTHRMAFSHDKCKVLTLSKQRFLAEPRVAFGPNNYLKPVLKAKYLGLIVDKQLTFNAHVTDLVERKTSTINFLSKYTNITRGCHQNVALLMYTTIARYALEYASVVWGDAAATTLRKVDSLQHRALCRALGANRLSHRSDVCVEAGVVPLEVRRKVELLRFWSAIHLHRRPLTTLLSNIPDHDIYRNRSRSSYLVRAKKLFTDLNITPLQASQLSKPDFDNISHSLWQQHWRTVRLSKPDQRYRNYHMLHQAINYPIPAPYHHTRRSTLAVWHMLRLSTAPLNEYLFSIKCHPTPICACLRADESIHHYLLQCRLYSAQRQCMLQVVRRIMQPFTLIDVTTLLGDPYLLPDQNLNSVFGAVTTYIHSTCRFLQ